MRRERPTAVTVLAVFHFVFGGLGLLCGLCQGFGAVVLAKAPADAPQTTPFGAQQDRFANEILKETRARAPWFTAYKVAEQAVHVVFSLMLIASGVGLLMVQSWGRWLSVTYAALRLLTLPLVFWYTFAVEVPAQEAAVQKAFADGGPPGAKTGAEVGIQLNKGWPLLLVVYPAVVLLIMFLPGTARAFSGEAEEEDDDGDGRRMRRDDDYDDYGRRRRRRDDYDDGGAWAER